MAWRYRLTFEKGLEELQVQKLHELEQQAAMSPGAKATYDKLLNRGLPKAESSGSDSSSETPGASSDSSGDTTDGDSSSEDPGADAAATDESSDAAADDATGGFDASADPTEGTDPAESEEPESQDKEKDDKKDDADKKEETKPATEELRMTRYSLEEITSEDVKHFGGGFLEHAKDVLVFIGLTVTPFVLGHLYRGVLAVIVRLIKLVTFAFRSLSTFMDRHFNSFEEIEKSVASALSGLEGKKEVDDRQDAFAALRFDNQRTIGALKTGTEWNPQQGLENLNQFLASFIPEMDKAFKAEVTSARSIMYVSQQGAQRLPEKLLKANIGIQSLSEGSTPGYACESGYVSSYRSKTALPGDAVVVGHLPKTDLTELSELIKAYNDSQLFLGVDQTQAVEVEQVPYLEKQAIESLLKTVSQIAALCKGHQKTYEDIQRAQSELQYSVKNHIKWLLSQARKISMSESFIEQIYLKATFADRVYLTAMMDLHDYTRHTLLAAVKYAEACSKKL